MRARWRQGLFWVLAVLAACAAPTPDSKLVRVDELPPAYRELWSAWVQRDPAWSERSEALAEDERLRGFFVDNLLRFMLQSYARGAFTQSLDGRLGDFERARGELLRRRQEALPRLVELLAIGNGQASELAASMLEEIGHDSVAGVSALLARQEPDARRRAADLLGRLPHARGEEPGVRAALIGVLESDPDWLVRAKAALALGARGSRDVTTAPARVALTRALGDRDLAVRVRAARALATLDDPRAVPALINYLERCGREGHYAGVQQAQEALRRLMREPHTHEPAEWRRLWSDSRKKAPSAR